MKSIDSSQAKLIPFLNLRKGLSKAFLEKEWEIPLLFLVVTEMIRIAREVTFHFTDVLVML